MTVNLNYYYFLYLRCVACFCVQPSQRQCFVKPSDYRCNTFWGMSLSALYDDKFTVFHSFFLAKQLKFSLDWNCLWKAIFKSCHKPLVGFRSGLRLNGSFTWKKLWSKPSPWSSGSGCMFRIIHGRRSFTTVFSSRIIFFIKSDWSLCPCRIKSIPSVWWHKVEGLLWVIC